MAMVVLTELIASQWSIDASDLSNRSTPTEVLSQILTPAKARLALAEKHVTSEKTSKQASIWSRNKQEAVRQHQQKALTKQSAFVEGSCKQALD